MKLQLRKVLLRLAAPVILLSGWNAHADWAKDLESPVTEKPALWTLAGGTALTLAVLATDHDVAAPFEKSTVEHKPLGKASKYGDVMGQLVPNALYAGGMGLAGYWGVPLGYARAEEMIAATAYAAVVTTALKYTIREPRPYDHSVRNSFPSGHSTTAFAFAGVVAAEHGWMYGVPAMALATFVGYSRINDHQHYLKDVVAGATVGLSCALGISYARQEERGKVASLQILPQPLPDGMELALNYRF